MAKHFFERSRAIVFCVSLVAAGQCLAQVEAPDPRELFIEDTRDFKQRQQDRSQSLLSGPNKSTADLDFKAPEVRYDREKDQFIGAGGVLLSQSDLKVRADEGKVKLKTKDAEFSGNVKFVSPDLNLSCDGAFLNVESETGEFSNSKLFLEQGGYSVKTDKVLKSSEYDFEMSGAEFSTCDCEDDSKPWSINCSSAKVTDGGYAHSYNTWIDLYGVPIFYTPYFVFPAKRERASGLLVPEYGYSNRDGTRLSLPFYAVLDGSSDMMLTPFTETRTRAGAKLDYREVASQYSKFEGRLVFSDESARDGSLRGTDPTGVFDPEIEESRWGAYVNQSWRSAPGAVVPLSLVTDLHLISDDLFLREMEEDKIGLRSDRFTTSRMALRSSFSNYWSAEVSGEYNQSIESDDDQLFQRLPEMNLNYSRSFRPFGFNPYGLKLASSNNLTVTEFARDFGFEGRRVEFNPRLQVPYRYKNILNGQIFGGMRETHYFTDNEVVPDGSYEIDDDKRRVYETGATLGTALEHPYDLSESNPLVFLSSLGAKNQNRKLTRVKHMIEPSLRYVYVPAEDQDGLPFYDSTDRLRQQSTFSYGVRNSIWGKRVASEPAGDEMAELTPMLSDLPQLGSSYQLSDPGFARSTSDSFSSVNVRSAEIRELAFFDLRHNYDYMEDKKDLDPERTPWSDVALDLGLTPSPYFGFLFESNVDYENSEMSSWAVSTHLKDDRGDLVRLRYTFIDNSVPNSIPDDVASQIEGSTEIKLVDRLRFGYYARFDEIESEFLDNTFAFRLGGSCNCWYLDLGYQETLNPQNESYLLRFTLKGLGDLAQSLALDEQEGVQE